MGKFPPCSTVKKKKKTQELSGFSPLRMPLAQQPEPQPFVLSQPGVLDAGSRETKLGHVIKHTHLMNDTKQTPASQNQFPVSVS